jgi:hypothetical protein
MAATAIELEAVITMSDHATVRCSLCAQENLAAFDGTEGLDPFRTDRDKEPSTGPDLQAGE